MQHNRLDVISLFLAHGVPVPVQIPEDNFSLLQTACVAEIYLETPQAIDLFRVVFQIPQLEIDFCPPFMKSTMATMWRSDVVAWLFHNGPSYDGVDEASLHEFCLRVTLRRLLLTLLRDGVEAAQSELMKYLAPADIQFRLRSNSISLIDDLFFGKVEFWDVTPGFYDEYQIDAEQCLIKRDFCWTIGLIWLSALEQLGIDIPSWLMYELSLHPFHMLNEIIWYPMDDDFVPRQDSRRILAYRIDPRSKDGSGFGDANVNAYASPKGGYLLGWDFADEVGGEMMFNAFADMIAQVELHEGGWPIFDDDEEEVQRKKRDRQKRKEIRTGIPGSWVEASDVC